MDDYFLVYHQFLSNIHNHNSKIWNTSCETFLKIQSIPRNLIHLFEQIRITNILRVDINIEKINNDKIQIRFSKTTEQEVITHYINMTSLGE